MALGGARPGAGRPRKSEKHRGAIAKAEKRIADRLPELIDLQFALAKGVSLVQSSKELQNVIEMLKSDPDEASAVVDKLKDFFAVAPDGNSGRYLIDRIMGKVQPRNDDTQLGTNSLADLAMAIRQSKEAAIDNQES
jgi:hypothetical protein